MKHSNHRQAQTSSVAARISTSLTDRDAKFRSCLGPGYLSESFCALFDYFHHFSLVVTMCKAYFKIE
jgi:hypothetical protein